MTNPALAARQQQARDTLWRTALGWRGMAFAAVLLSGAAGAALWLDYADTTPSGQIDASRHPFPTPRSIAATASSGPTPVDRKAIAVGGQPAQPSSLSRVASMQPRSAAAVTGNNRNVAATQPVQLNRKPKEEGRPSTALATVSNPAGGPTAQSPTNQFAVTPCAIIMSDDEHVHGVAVVKAEIPTDTALASVARDEAKVHGRIDPAYIDLRRVLAFAGDHHLIVVIPLGIDVKIGDRIGLQGSYRSRSVSCRYVPIVATDDFGPPATGAEKPSKLNL